MADLFISYAREDRTVAARLANRLQRAGFSVWWDRSLLAGDDIERVIDAEINNAKAVIVIWSANSAPSTWVRSVASAALAAKKLVPILVDEEMEIGSVHGRMVAGHVLHVGLVHVEVTDLAPVVAERKLLPEHDGVGVPRDVVQVGEQGAGRRCSVGINGLGRPGVKAQACDGQGGDKKAGNAG